jgi:hypothetical protein
VKLGDISGIKEGISDSLFEEHETNSKIKISGTWIGE